MGAMKPPLEFDLPNRVELRLPVVQCPFAFKSSSAEARREGRELTGPGLDAERKPTGVPRHRCFGRDSSVKNLLPLLDGIVLVPKLHECRARARAHSPAEFWICRQLQDAIRQGFYIAR